MKQLGGKYLERLKNKTQEDAVKWHARPVWNPCGGFAFWYC